MVGGVSTSRSNIPVKLHEARFFTGLGVLEDFGGVDWGVAASEESGGVSASEGGVGEDDEAVCAFMGCVFCCIFPAAISLYLSQNSKSVFLFLMTLGIFVVSHRISPTFLSRLLSPKAGIRVPRLMAKCGAYITRFPLIESLSFFSVSRSNHIA